MLRKLSVSVLALVMLGCPEPVQDMVSSSGISLGESGGESDSSTDAPTTSDESTTDESTTDESTTDGGEAACGDGTVDPGEACDPGAPLTQDCTDHGFEVGTVACSEACEIVVDCGWSTPELLWSRDHLVINYFWTDVAVGPDDQILVSGFHNDNGIELDDTMVGKFTPDGDLWWEQNYRYGDTIDDHGESIIVDHTGSIFVAVKYFPGDNFWDTALFGLESNGDERFRADLGQSNNSHREPKLALSHDHEYVYVTSFWSESWVKVRTLTGYSGDEYVHETRQSWGIAISGDTMVIAGRQMAMGGNLEWYDDWYINDEYSHSVVHAGPNADEGVAAAATADGFAVIGEISDGASVLYVYDEVGNELWSTTFAEPGVSHLPFDVLVSDSGAIYVFARTQGDAEYGWQHFWKFTPDGELVADIVPVDGGTAAALGSDHLILVTADRTIMAWSL
jgi:hypothetical protein